MKLVYLIGEPGIGKTTLMKAITAQLGGPVVEQNKPVHHLVYARNTIQLGRDRPDFGGTDALPMNVQPQVVEFLRSKPAHLILGEGDRLTNRKFFMEVGRFLDLRVVWLVDMNGSGIAERRRAARAHAVGKVQDEQWVRSRITKVRGLADLVSRRIDAGLPLVGQVGGFWQEAVR
jgi:hypothetical protein